MRCIRCHRPLKHASSTGMGPVCLRAVTGAKPARVRLFDRRVRRSADERQVEIAFEVAT